MNALATIPSLRQAALAFALLASLLALPLPSRAQPVAHLAPPPTSFAEASALYRAGRHAAAYARFVTLANEGDMQAARVALVMHRFGAPLFGSDWDATTEELEDWSRLARLAEARDLARRRLGEPFEKHARPGPVPAPSNLLPMETFRAHKRRPARTSP